MKDFFLNWSLLRELAEGLYLVDFRSERDAAKRGEFSQQGVEAVNAQTFFGSFRDGLLLGGVEAVRLGHGTGTWGSARNFVFEKDGLEFAAHVPLQVVGEHADKDVGADHVFPAMEDRAHLKGLCLDGTEG